MQKPKQQLMIDDMVYSYHEKFSSFGKITTMAGRDINRQALLDGSINILIIRSRTQVNQTLLQGTQVRFVGSTVSGLDHIDLDYLRQNNITFAHAGGCNANAVAEYVISALVNLSADKGLSLTTKTMAIIGVGNTGTALHYKAQKLGIKTVLNDPPRQKKEYLPYFVDLNTALQADIISFHTPITKTGSYPSYHLLSKHNAHLIKPNTIIINAARGGVIDEQVWQNLPTLANIIDCWENEPHIKHTLSKTAYLATPHIAGHSIDAKFMGSFVIYEQLCAWLNQPVNQALKNLIKPDLKPLNTHTLVATLNAIYDFKQDMACLDNPNDFENYRRNYPPRYEWQHFNHLLLNTLC